MLPSFAMSAMSPLMTKVLCVVLLAGSLYFLLSVPVNIHAASQLDASPLCSAQETSDCVRDVKLTVVAVYGGKSKRATVVMPDGHDADLRLVTSGGWNVDNATLDQLIPGQQVSARQWRGKIISLQTAWQTNIFTSDNPHTGQLLYLVIGIFGILVAVAKLRR